MKNLSYLLILMSCLLSHAYAQDIITTKNAKTIPAKVVEVRDDSVLYKRYYQQQGATFSIIKSDVVSIQYEKDTTTVAATHIPTILDSLPPNHDYYKHGRQDARKYYNGGNAATVGTIFATLVSPIGGLIPAITTAATQPKEKNLNYPDATLMQQKDYRLGYTRKAHQIKSSKIWGGFGFAMVVNIVALISLGVI